ncbi:MAG: restriction endonuclease subunit M [Anaerolineaceae bacterium]|nr:MAG: restriction endonuclease subunit M [Anaerolineaceae bacterium]
MLTKKQIQALKSDDIQALYALISNPHSNAELLFILENLGRLPAGFVGDALLPYITHQNDDIRYWAVKNIGKLGDLRYLNTLYERTEHEANTIVRRELVSAIGRMRDATACPHLSRLLEDPDPKIVIQAIRGLLVFKQAPEIRERLLALCDHPNEQIQLILRKEFGDHDTASDYGHHTDSPNGMKNVAVLGDVRDVLRFVPDGSIHLTFTSPPYYNARDYSIYDSYEGYLDFLGEVFDAVHRTTKEGRFLIVNTSPIIIPRISRQYASKRYAIPFDLHARLVKAGWEFIDDIVWAKPEASVKNRNGGFMQHRKPLAYKPNAVTEYVMVYRKATTRLIDWNIKQYPQTVIDASRVDDAYETSNLWHIEPKSDRVHSAIFPEKLCDWVIRYYSYVGDLVFDPFGGSGTLAKAAVALNRYFFLTEIMPEYFERIQQTVTGDLFQTFPSRFVTTDSFAHDMADRTQR